MVAPLAGEVIRINLEPGALESMPVTDNSAAPDIPGGKANAISINIKHPRILSIAKSFWPNELAPRRRLLNAIHP
jgi:hypothetical protein